MLEKSKTFKNSEDNSFIKCGKYSKVSVEDGYLVFKRDKEFESVNFEFYKTTLRIEDLKNDKEYTVCSKYYTADILVKMGDNIYFFYKKNFTERTGNIYFVRYNLKDNKFYRIKIEDILVDEYDRTLKFGYYSTVSINKDRLMFNYEHHENKDSFEVESIDFIIDKLEDGNEYFICEYDDKRDCFMKLDNIIYFYCMHPSIPLESIISFSYDIETKEVNSEIKGCTLENIKAFDAISKLANLNVEFYDTGINTKATVIDNYIRVIDEANNDTTYAISLLKPNRIYTLNRINKLIDFMVLIDGKVLFGYGVIDGDYFKSNTKKVYDIDLNKFLDPSEEHDGLLEKSEGDDFLDYRNNEEYYNNLMSVLKKGTSAISSEEGKQLITDLVNEIINLNNCVKLYSNAFLQSQNVVKVDSDIITNTVLRYDYIKKYLTEGMFQI